MKFTYFNIISLTSISLVLAQLKLNRQIVINHETTERVIITESTRRTMKSWNMNPASNMVRRTTTIPHVVDKTCLLLPDPGPCRGRISMWYFDPATKNCSAFYWGGCQGNGNRFDKKAECYSTCLSPPGWKEARPRYCSLAFDYGWCFGADERYYYDRHWGVCKKTIYSGCGGNKNNFYSKEKCDDVCRFGSWSLHPRKAPKDGMKKVLIVNPVEMTETPARVWTTPTASTKKRTGSWWMPNLNKINPNKKFLDMNKDVDDKSTNNVPQQTEGT